MSHRHRTGQFDRTASPGYAVVNGATKSEAQGLADGPGRLIRASDADRESVAAALRQHAAEGRLTMQEFEERLGNVYAATTYGDLQALLADLPRLPGAGPTTVVPVLPAELGGARRAGRGPRLGLVIFIALCWAIWGISVATSSGHSLEGLWPLWLMLLGGLAFLRRRPPRLTSVSRDHAAQ
jgi:MYXO-CTERM domain-containing protein